MNIYVGNLPYKITEQELTALFAEYGDVISAKIIVDRDTGRSKGFGFVEMPDAKAAKAAMEGLEGRDVDGRGLRLSEARPKPNRGDRPPRRHPRGPSRPRSAE